MLCDLGKRLSMANILTRIPPYFQVIGPITFGYFEDLARRPSERAREGLRRSRGTLNRRWCERGGVITPLVGTFALVRGWWWWPSPL